LRREHTAEFAKIAESTSLRAFRGVESLLTAIHQRGPKVGLATSSTKEELQTTLNGAKADWIDQFDVIANSEDADESKPSLDILEAAIGAKASGWNCCHPF
jgi:phosphoglycolate phosphatase-like HAD superfamily hydrolase